MVDNLTPTPDQGPDDEPINERLAKSAGKPGIAPPHVKKEAAKKMAGDTFTHDKDTPVTIEEYHRLMADRPIKFGLKSSGFTRDGGKDGHPCLSCVHFYVSPASAHSTCEIVRVSDEDDQVKQDDTCKLWSNDGKALPLLENKKEAEA